MPFDQGQFEVGFAPASRPAPILPVVPVSRTDKVLDVLVKARALITDKKRWIKGDYCRGDSFCVYGAIQKAGGFTRVSDAEYSPAAVFLEKTHGSRYLNTFNDHPTTTHADVLALFDRAIAARTADGKASAPQATAEARSAGANTNGQEKITHA